MISKAKYYILLYKFFEKRVLRRTLGPKGDEMKRG
jgi:hypothetical protein